jgi:hypothetical protein
MRPTFRPGPTLSLVATTDTGAELTGTSRLPPGCVVALVGLSPSRTSARDVYVRAWQVATVDAGRVTYRGFVEWTYGDRRLRGDGACGVDLRPEGEGR